ncbi:hypothetical protein AAC387_Pa08g1450 [Persea americana]
MKKEGSLEASGPLKSGDGGDEKVPFFKLFSFADALDFVLMIVGTVAAIFSGFSMPLMTLLFGQLINKFGDTHKSDIVHVIAKVALKFVYLAVASGISSFLQVSCWMVTGERQATRIRGLYLKSILRQEIAFFDKETTAGEVIARMSGDTVLIQDAMGEKVGKFIQLVSLFFSGFVVAFAKGWQLALVMASCLPPMIVAGASVSKILSKMSSRGQRAYTEAATIAEQVIGSIRTVVSFSGEKQAITKYDKSLKTAYTSAVQQGLAVGLGVGFYMLIVFSTYALAVWYASLLIIKKGYSAGDVSNVMFAIMAGGTTLGQASPCLNAFAAGKAAAYKMFKIIDRKPEIDASDNGGIELENMKGDIELRDVYFSYPARPDVQIFSGFSLHVPSGMTAAIVGGSGSGKSTVISLIERFYDPKAGEVLIDGINLKKLHLEWIRQRIGMVSQEPVLFNTTIKDNIAYGKAGATLEEIKVAIELAHASKFIERMPQGLETMVGERGTHLSGGQKQRIAIARAILKNPKILLLDEATSALDAESEHIVQEALVRIMSNQTTVVVAHRLSTVRNADTIVVLHGGKVVEQGSHSELIKDLDGPYSKLIHLQEANKHEKEFSTMDPPSVDSSFDNCKEVILSRRQRFSLKRSISRNSSVGGSSRHSFAVPFGLIDPMIVSVLEDDQGKESDDNGPDKTQQKVSMRRLAYLNKPELPVILLGTIAAVAHGVIFPGFGILMSSAIKIFFEPQHELRKDARFWAMMFIIVGISALIAIPLQQYLFGVAGAKLIQRIRSLSFKRVVHQEISYFDEPRNSSGAILARLSADASTVRILVGDALALVVQNFSTATTGLVIAMVVNWRLAFIILAMLPLVGMQGYAQTKFLQGFSSDAKAMYEEASQVANDAVSSIRTVVSFCSEQKVVDLYKKICEAATKNGVWQGIISGVGFGISNFVLYCTYALIFYVGAHFVEEGKATFSQVFQVFFSLAMAAFGVAQTSARAPDATNAKVSVASIFSILDRKSKIDASIDEGISLLSVEGEIEFHHVSFKYPTRPDVQIFTDLCLHIQSGMTVALVGESGSGKSTVIALLERFYNPDSGQIFLDGIEIQKFKLQWLRQQMGLVSQEPILFNDTIRANIAYGKHGEVPEEEIITASETANAHCFISSLPHGYDTSVGERGVQLSGGQKQRIAIARAIMKQPKIILLDEATSALDAESEHVVQEALDRMMVNRSTIVVAHRLSTIKGADLIAVVKNGVIAEKGTHEMLMKMTDGLYASLASLDMSSSN